MRKLQSVYGILIIILIYGFVVKDSLRFLIGFTIISLSLLEYIIFQIRKD